MILRATFAASFATIFIANAAYASILTSTGAVTIATPPNVRDGALPSDTQIVAFAERHGITLPQDLTFNISVPGTSPSPTDINASPVTLPAGTRVDSYFVHMKSVTGTDPNPALVSGSITFDRPILGIAVFDLRLDQSDPALGLPTTLYPTGVARELDIVSGGVVGHIGNDSITLSGDRRTVIFNIGNTGGLDQARIVTAAVPEPSTLALWLIACLILGVRYARRNYLM
jgi:hypothetical protein